MSGALRPPSPWSPLLWVLRMHAGSWVRSLMSVCASPHLNRFMALGLSTCVSTRPWARKYKFCSIETGKHPQKDQ